MGSLSETARGPLRTTKRTSSGKEQEQANRSCTVPYSRAGYEEPYSPRARPRGSGETRRHNLEPSYGWEGRRDYESMPQRGKLGAAKRDAAQGGIHPWLTHCASPSRHFMHCSASC